MQTRKGLRSDSRTNARNSASFMLKVCAKPLALSTRHSCRVAKSPHWFSLVQIVMNGPPPEEFQRQLQDFIRQHLSGGSMPKTDSITTDETQPEGDAKEFTFNKKPRDIKAYLDRFV